MTGILCRATAVPHRHDTADHVRACHAAAAGIRTAPSTPSVRPNDGHPGRRVVYTDSAPTDAQIWKVGKEGGDPDRARRMTRLGASQYINQLIAAKENRPVNDVPAARPTVRPATIVPLPMLQSVRPGRYAWRPDALSPWTFVRISIAKTGDFKGCLKVQTQHAESYRERMIVWPDGRVRLDSGNRFIEPILLGIIVDQTQAAIDYGREKGRCTRCGIELTLQRSIHYSVGSECEKVMGHIIARIDEANGGMSFETLRHLGMLPETANA